MTAYSFFPFTHTTAAQNKILEAFFKEVRVLDIDGAGGTLNEQAPGESRLISCSLSHDRAASLDRLFADYMAWARLHRGNEKNLKHLLKDTPYFKSDTDLTSIRSQIVSPKGDEGGSETASDPGLFLKLAQNLDRETEAIDNRLSELDEGRESFLSELKGEVGATERPGDPGSRPSDPGRIMPAERVAAWAALAREAGMLSGNCPALVTTSPEIFTWLEENAGPVINGLDIDSIKVHENGCKKKDRWLQDFDNLLDKMIAGSPPDREQGDALKQDSGCCHLSGYFKVRLFPGEMLSRTIQNPGRQMAVCLVGLNS